MNARKYMEVSCENCKFLTFVYLFRNYNLLIKTSNFNDNQMFYDNYQSISSIKPFYCLFIKFSSFIFSESTWYDTCMNTTRILFSEN